MKTPSTTVALSALAHSAAIGVLLMLLRPVPYPDPAPTVMTVEVSIEPEQAPGSGPDVTARAPPSEGPGSMRQTFDLPARPSFKFVEQFLGIDRLGAMLDCLTVGGLSREAPGQPPRAHRPCAYADLALGPPMIKLPAEESESGESAARIGADYRTFKTIQPMFDESLFPEKKPQANRALKKWFMGLFQ